MTHNLSHFDLFKGLPEDSLLKLETMLKPVQLEPEQVLFNKGDFGDSVFLVKSGKLKVVSTDAEGNEVVLNQVGPGAVIGEMSLLDHGPRSAGVAALNRVELYALSSADFLSVLQSQPQMGLEISRSLIQRLRFATTYIENAIEWSQLIAKGDYSFIDGLKEEQGDSSVDSDRERAARFLGAFFQMVEEIKAREDELKQELVRLKIEIDQTKRKQEVDEIAESDFFKKIREEKKKRTQK